MATPFALLAPKHPQAPQTGLSSLRDSFGVIENMLQMKNPIGIVYLDIAKYGELEGKYGQETFDEIVITAARVLEGFSGKLFRKDDHLLLSEELGDVFVLVFSNTRSHEQITLDVLEGISVRIQETIGEEFKKLVSGLIQQKIGFFTGYSILYPDARINSQRQVFRAIKQAAQMSLGREYDEFERKMSHLRGIIRGNQLTSYFQPIVNFNPFNVMGYELLTRGPNGGRLVDAEMMFQIAQRGGLALELEHAARNKAVETLWGKPFKEKLFLNNAPRIIMSPDFSDLLIYERMGWEPNQIVIEITEGEAINNLKDIRNRLEVFRREGCQIAVDDMGKGNSGLYLLTELKPDFAKIDMTLVRGIDTDDMKQRLLRKLIEFSENSNTRFIAEGIETMGEYHTLRDLGIAIGQGFLFGTPQPKPIEPEASQFAA